MINYLYSAWLGFLTILLGEIAADYLIRKNSSDFYSLGMDETLWFLIHILAFIYFAFFITKGVLESKDIFKRITILLVNAVLSLAVYSVLIYGYIIKSGIDAL